MLLRILTALALAPVALLLTMYLPTQWFSVILLAVMLMGLNEWNQLTVKSPALFSVAAVGLAIVTWLITFQSTILFVICIFTSLFWCFQVYDLKRFELSRPIAPVPAFLLGAGCLMGAWAGLVLIHQQPENGPVATIALLVMVWAADSFAYFSGKTFGRTKLAPNISPNKTVEGVFGGLTGTILVAGSFGIFALGLSSNTIWIWIAAGLGAALFSVVGDLYESRLKRLAGVKDSGSLLPGHGGVLDRIDGLIAATPVFVTLWNLSQLQQI
jgi:phosphatidate cytidylyltransferase